VIYSSDLFTYRPNAKYFQTLSGEKLRSFANSLRSMLKHRSTVHEVARQFSNLAYSSELMFVWPGHFYNYLLLGHCSLRIGYQREQNYAEIVLKHVFKITLLHFAQ